MFTHKTKIGGKDIETLTWKKFKTIHKKIMRIYPFLSNTEQEKFEGKTRKIIADRHIFADDQLGTLRQLLSNLDNPHANVIRIHSGKTNLKKGSISYIKNRILYIKILSWSALNLDEGLRFSKNLIKLCQRKTRKCDGIIIDVRDNQGGNSKIAHEFAGIFFDKDIEFGTLVEKLRGRLRKRPYILEKNETTHINLPIIILINNKCFSSNELFIAPFKTSGRATLVGEKTQGGSANPLNIEFKLDNKKYSARIPRWKFYLKGKNKPIEETGITPDFIYYKQDIVDFSIKHYWELVHRHIRRHKGSLGR